MIHDPECSVSSSFSQKFKPTGCNLNEAEEHKYICGAGEEPGRGIEYPFGKIVWRVLILDRNYIDERN